MLNRRILRIKAMQALYAYDLALASLKEIFAEKAAEAFKYDPAYHDSQEKPEFDKRAKLVTSAFQKAADGQTIENETLSTEEVEAIDQGVIDYKNAIDQEVSAGRRRMEEEVKNIYRTYLKILLLPGEVAFIERKEKERLEKKNGSKSLGSFFNFTKNPVLDALNSYQPLLNKSISEKLAWNGEEENVRKWYKNHWSKNDEIIDYQSIKEPSTEQHHGALKYLLKNLVFKSEEIDEFMGEKDLYWSENKAILKSMVTKTIQSYEPEAEEPFELKALSLNEKDDFHYFRVLYEETIKRDQELEGIIAKKTRNWDMSRVAALDKIILKMALTEMFSFPSIPIKVTINEFIEISKKYSTPKSKQFVNGILDVLANELTSEGLIKKSGRGLIDNK